MHFPSDEKSAKPTVRRLGLFTVAFSIATLATRWMTPQDGIDLLSKITSPEQAEMIVANGFLTQAFLYPAIFLGVLFLVHLINYLIVKNRG